MTAPVALTQRRRAQTREEIHRAAVDLVLQRGLAQVTVDEIAEAAGVSPRTFFNYFPTKHDAIVLELPPLPPEALARFLDGKGRLREDLRDLLVAYVRQSPRRRHELRRLHTVVRANPELSPLMQQRFRAFEAQLADAVARRLGQPSVTFEASVIAAVAAALLRAASWSWCDSGDETSLSDRLTEAFAALGHLD